MGANLYLMSDGMATEMTEHRYSMETDLQKIIADNPNLLVRNSEPEEARLLLVAREFGVAEGEDGGVTFRLDHLMVDQSGIPVLVEVKRCTNTQLRREVVGQIMDYASRMATADANELREMFRDNNDGEVLEEYDTDEFWDKVATCLKAERLKLVFASDRIPVNLKLMIEFLDRNLNGIDVYGVELRQYKTDNAVLLSSSVVGETPLKAKNVAVRPSAEWTAANFSSYLLERKEDDLEPIISELMAYAVELGLKQHPGRGAQVPIFKFKRGTHSVFRVMGWWKKSVGYLCAFEVYIRECLLYEPGISWGEDVLRELFSNIPGRTEAETAGQIWNTKDFLCIDIRALLEERNFSYIKTAMKALYNAIVESEQGNLPPPNFSAFNKLHKGRQENNRRCDCTCGRFRFTDYHFVVCIVKAAFWHGVCRVPETSSDFFHKSIN